VELYEVIPCFADAVRIASVRLPDFVENRSSKNMRRILASSLVVLSAFGNPAFGQTTVYPPPQKTAAPTQAVAPLAAPAPTAAPVAAIAAPNAPDALGRYMLRDGTDVNLVFAQDLSSKTSSEGDPVTLTLVDDLKVGDTVVAKAGSKAIGEVTKAEKSGMMGKAGELNIRLNYLKVGDAKIKLRGTKGKEGESGTTGAVVLTVLFGPIGLIKHGKNVEIKQGQSLHAFVGDDIALVPAS
jgi:hypothetical protein